MKDTRNVNQDSQPLGQDLNPGILKKKQECYPLSCDVKEQETNFYERESADIQLSRGFLYLGVIK